MRKEFVRDLALAIVFFGAVFACVNTIDWMSLIGIKPDFIEQQESKLIWKAVKMQFDEMQNDQVYDAVDCVVNNICLKNDLDTASVHVVISSSREVNAFATVGGHLIVNRGLLRDCRNESELAGVVSHEIAHIQLHHLRINYLLKLLVT